MKHAAGTKKPGARHVSPAGPLRLVRVEDNGRQQRLQRRGFSGLDGHWRRRREGLACSAVTLRAREEVKLWGACPSSGSDVAGYWQSCRCLDIFFVVETSKRKRGHGEAPSKASRRQSESSGRPMSSNMTFSRRRSALAPTHESWAEGDAQAALKPLFLHGRHGRLGHLRGTGRCKRGNALQLRALSSAPREALKSKEESTRCC